MRPGDLDDPAPIEPDDSLLERVHERSGALRHRRHLRRLTGAGAAALVVVFAVVVAIAVPDGDDSAEPNRPAATTTTTTQPAVTFEAISGEWRPASIAGYDGPLARLAVRARLTFAGDGKLSGFDGCNGFTGSYELGPNASFDVAEFGQTLIACDDQLPMQQTLGATARVEVSDRQLVLMAADGRELAEFVRPVVTARIELPSDTLVAGSIMQSGRVIIDNQTGHMIRATGCGSLFQVALRNDSYEPGVGWLDCLMRFDIPTGISTHDIAVSASTMAGIGAPRPLAPGRYEATLYQRDHIVPDPATVSVTVVARDDETGAFSAADLERELVDTGYDIADNGSTPGGFGARTIERLCANGTQISVYAYADEAARREVSAGMSADGSTLGRGNSRVIVDWVGPPHFYARGRILALVLQDDTALLQTLSEIMGPTISPEAYRSPRAKAACG